MRDVLVPEIILYQPGICAPVSERISSSVPQHMGMNGQVPETGCCGVFPNKYADRESEELFATFK
jgi:hypothetical protein